MADWSTARAVAEELAERGVDPLDIEAARAARAGLRNRFVLDLLLIAGLCAVAMSLALMFMRAVRGQDPLGGNELWIGSAGLLLALVSVVLRSVMPGRAQAYEVAWSEFVQRVWPGTGRGDDLGAARLDFVRRAASADPGGFPSAAPGRKP
ncbi:MAG TPA: hypothetical protein VL294_10435 [Pseudolysinimonas sp.]|jgi:hypothetical protein|nr:hypothetical protein [Pseudolysinimonas sp.]